MQSTDTNKEVVAFTAAHMIFDNDTSTVGGAVMVRIGPPSDPSEVQVNRLIEDSGVLDFWNSEDEGVYSHTDGEPI